MPIKNTLEKVLQQFYKVHGNLYSYTNFQYNGLHSKSLVTCNIHGDFVVTPGHHIHMKSGCPTCAKINQSKEQRKNLEKVKSDFAKKHKDYYDYSLITEETYISNKIKVSIICPEHGVFEQRPDSHLQGQGCKYCEHKSFPNTVEYIKESILKIHPDYDLSYITNYKNNKTKLPIVCPIHGLFHIKYNSIITQHQGCPVCKNSKGESIIFKYLTSKGISFIPQYKFDDCRSPLYRNIRLPFDFFLPDYNICIEFDGRQHFEVVDFSHGSMNQKDIQKQFENTKRNDSIKTKYCIDNNIRLIRIPYWELKNIQVILENNL